MNDYGVLDVTSTELIWSLSRWAKFLGYKAQSWRLPIAEIDVITIGRVPPMVAGGLVAIEWTGGRRELEVQDLEGLDGALRRAHVRVHRIG